ncbi:MAG: hydroxymethylglutaryl-CoA lyase [Pseudomonadota bacterium]
MASQNVGLVEVSARDGIQNEQNILSTDDKLDLLNRIWNAGIRRAEVTSFVNPKRVPQMADATEVATGLGDEMRCGAMGLVLNEKGFERARAAGLMEINVVVVATDTFCQRNQGTDLAESIAAFGRIRAAAKGKMRVGVTIGAAFGCPFEGEVGLARLMQVIDGCAAHDPDELALADTIGVGTPADVMERVGALRAALPHQKTRLHLHNTRGTGLANAWAGIEAGIDALDSSLGGVGGCPFAPNATGNIATEDLVYMLERSGIATGVDLDAAIQTAEWLETKLGIRAPGNVLRAGGFPKGQAA